MNICVINNIPYNIYQINGQRFSYPIQIIQNSVSKPANVPEIYIAKIPADIYEDTLLPIFSHIGPIYQFRLMLNYSGQNRGYGYLMYMDEQSTERALRFLNNFQINYNQRLILCLSTNNCKLILGKISQIFSALDIAVKISKIEPKYVSVSVSNKGHYKEALIEYNSHRDAAIARRALITDIAQFGPDVWLRWSV